ncbi:MAG TPA: conjugative transposon protein TraJ [Puia sp.]|nr:conjugative transposon protein TraJ [Puia sp.]
MKSKYGIGLLLAGAGVALPFLSQAQDDPGALPGGTSGLQGALETVYDHMSVHFGELIGVGRGIAGFGALWYIAYRVWGHLARAEAIDFFPLLRPFAIGLALIFYPFFIGLLNGVMQPTVSGTASLVNDSNTAIATLLQLKEQALEQSTEWQMYVGPSGFGDQEKWEQYSGDASTGTFSGITNGIKFGMAKYAYEFKNSIKVWMSELLQLLFEAAALCVNTVRTFYLVILAIVGPLVLGLSVFDGFHFVLPAWIARYINVFLWLPVANILGSVIGQIQEEMIKIDIQQLQATGQTSFGATDAAYLVFLILGIVGYFTVPSITNHIIMVFPVGGAHLQKVTNEFESTTTGVVTATGEGAKALGSAAASLII